MRKPGIIFLCGLAAGILLAAGGWFAFRLMQSRKAAMILEQGDMGCMVLREPGPNVGLVSTRQLSLRSRVAAVSKRWFAAVHEAQTETTASAVRWGRFNAGELGPASGRRQVSCRDGARGENRPSRP